MISIQCNNKNSFIEVMAKVHKEGYLLKEIEPDVCNNEPYKRYVVLFENKTFEWSNFINLEHRQVSALEYLSMFIS